MTSAAGGQLVGTPSSFPDAATAAALALDAGDELAAAELAGAELAGRLRQLVRVENAIVGIDLADKKQMVVVTDHPCWWRELGGHRCDRSGAASG